MHGEKMEAEMREQPGLLKKSWPAYREQAEEAINGKSFEMVLLAARGSSDNAALYARYLIEIFLGVPVVLAAPSVLTRYGSHIRYPKTLAIGISQSGAAPDVAEVLADLRETGHRTLAITNTPGSALTQVAEHSLLLELGTEQAVAATKTYSASLLALYAVCVALGADLGSPVLPDDRWIEICGEQAARETPKLPNCENLFALARGIRFCSAEESALKMMECALLSCLAYSQADFEHGPKALASETSAALIYGDPPKSWLNEGFHCFQAPVRADVPEPSLPLWDCIYAQWMALLAARERDLDPDRPERLLKVTKTL